MFFKRFLYHCTAPLPPFSCQSLVWECCKDLLASLLAEKWDRPYSNTLAWMKCKLSFALLRSSIHCIRGARSVGGCAFKQAVVPTDLVVQTSPSKLLRLIDVTASYFSVYIYILYCSHRVNDRLSATMKLRTDYIKIEQAQRMQVTLKDRSYVGL